MPQFATSGTTGVPKTYTITEEQMARRIAHMNDASRGVGFEALKSIFIDWTPNTYFGIVYARYAEQHGMNAYHTTHGSIEAIVELFKSENIEGITSTPQGLVNYARAAKGSYRGRGSFGAVSPHGVHRGRRIVPPCSGTSASGLTPGRLRPPLHRSCPT